MEETHFVENVKMRDFQHYVDNGYFIIKNNRLNVLRLPPDGWTILPLEHGAIKELNDDMIKFVASNKISIIASPDAKEKTEEIKKVTKKSAKIEEQGLVQESEIFDVKKEEEEILNTVEPEVVNVVSEPQNSDSL
jgi:hypothetical protein